MKIINAIGLVGLALCLNSSLAAQTDTEKTPPIYSQFEQIDYLFHQENDTTYIINFWATWCKPCVEELPYIEQLHDVYAKEKMRIILVSLDFPRQIETKLLPFMEQNKLQSEVIVLTDGKYNDWIDKVSTEWDGAIPVTLVYKGQERSFIKTEVGSFEELNQVVAPFFKTSDQ